MHISTHTALSGSGRLDDIEGHPQGEIRGRTKLVNIIKDVRKFAAQQQISEEDALRVGLEQKVKEFPEKAPRFTRKPNSCFPRESCELRTRTSTSR